MKSEILHADESPGGDSMLPSSTYPQTSWHNGSPYSQSPYAESSVHEYPHYTGYMHGVPSEPLPGMSASLCHQSLPHVGHMTHHHLPMLTTTSTWPSELTQAHSNNYSVSSSTLVATPIIDTSEVKPSDKARKTLTFDQKKRICLLHESNPKMRQADIGVQFNVERRYVFYSPIQKEATHRI